MNKHLFIPGQIMMTFGSTAILMFFVGEQPWYDLVTLGFALGMIFAGFERWSKWLINEIRK